jgi:hypothetical protein
MSALIDNKQLNFDEKIKSYNQTLNKFITMYTPDAFGLTSIITDINNKEQVVETQKKFKEEVIDVIKNELDNFSDNIKPKKKSNVKRIDQKQPLISKKEVKDLDVANILVSKRPSKKPLKFQVGEAVKQPWVMGSDKNYFQ